MYPSLFLKIIEQYKAISAVEAIAIGGSSVIKTNDKTSDIDIYVFSSTDIPLEKRFEIVSKISSKYEIGGEYFGAGDEYYCDEINKIMDVMYWNVPWFEGVIGNVWDKHYPSNGYTTCFLHTLKHFEILYDKNNWLKNLQNKINNPYPQELKQNIIERNIKLMKDKPFASYYEQVEKALKRNDVVSVNHRLAAFLASYFDVVFAANEIFHPGEKRLVQYALSNCSVLPCDFEQNIDKLFKAKGDNILQIMDDIIDNLRIII